jgi:hypothetical protein
MSAFGSAKAVARDCIIHHRPGGPMTCRALILATLALVVFDPSPATADVAAGGNQPPLAVKARGPVSDPVTVGHQNGAWAVYRYEPGPNVWSMWKSPQSPLPPKAFTGVGPHAAAVVDPKNRFAGWLFNLDAQTWSPLPLSPLAGSGSNGDPHVVTFIGDSLLLWGWNRQPPHGAILDLKTMQWKVMADAPVRASDAPTPSSAAS